MCFTISLFISLVAEVRESLSSIWHDIASYSDFKLKSPPSIQKRCSHSKKDAFL